MSMLRIKKSSKIEGNICFSNLNINIIILNKYTFAIGSNFSSRKIGSVCALNGADLIVLTALFCNLYRDEIKVQLAPPQTSIQ